MPNLPLYTTQDKKVKVELYELGESVYLNQDSIAKLFTLKGLHLKKLRFDTSKSSIEHITNILKEGELRADSVIREIRTTANDGKQYKVKFYSLEMILAIGFRVWSKNFWRQFLLLLVLYVKLVIKNIQAVFCYNKPYFRELGEIE